eukprot:gene4232-64631_t
MDAIRNGKQLRKVSKDSPASPGGKKPPPPPMDMHAQLMAQIA